VRLPTERMLEEEAQHFPRRIRPVRVGVGPGGTAARPCVSGAIDVPVFGDFPTSRVAPNGASIGMTVGYPSVKYLRCRSRRSDVLLDNLIGILRMHSSVSTAMENDGRHRRFAVRNCLGAASLPHGGERRGKITRGPARQARMNTDGSVKVAVRGAHDGGGGPA